MSAPEEPPDDTGRDRHGVQLALLGVFVLLGGLYLAGYFLLGGRVPTGISVAGVDIGGMTPAAAENELRRELLPSTDDPLRLTYAGETYQIDPEEAGLSFDVASTVTQAGGGRSWDPRRMVQVVLGDDDVDPIITVDEEALSARIAELAEQVDVDPVEPAIIFSDNASFSEIAPAAGVAVDVTATEELVLDNYPRSDSPLELPTRTTQPQVGRAGVRAAITGFARPAVSAPVRLLRPGRDIILRVGTYGPALRMQVVDGELTPMFDVDLLGERLTKLTEGLGAQPRNATVALRGGRPVVVPDRRGLSFDPAEIADAVLPVLDQSGAKRQAEVSGSTARADFTTADARRLRIREQVSSFVTYYPHEEYRNINQGRAAELINGTVLEPGELFSFNGTVGERTRANGFTVGFIISNGVFAQDLGGGVSQVATTTFNAAFFAGLKDVEHKPHSFYIDRYPVGREATVAWPDVDLRFRNTTPYGVLIEAWVVPSTPPTSGEMHVRMWSTKYWDIEAGESTRYNFSSPGIRYDSSDTCVPQSGLSGFDIDVYRYFRRVDSSELVRRETMHADYLPADTVICT